MANIQGQTDMDTDKIVAAIFAAAMCSKGEERP